MPAEARFKAMGSDVHVVVLGSSRLLEDARASIDRLEARWSRFRPDSEISQLNAMPGVPVRVSSETFLLIERALEGWRMSDGRFDPTVLGSVIAAGYDRSFDQLDPLAKPPRTDLRVGSERIELNPVSLCVTLPPGVGIDPGGIGKGLAADIVFEELLSSGADGACVNIGGDIRLGGASPEAGGWTVGIEHPLGLPGSLAMGLDEGAIATSARTKRTWIRDDVRAHHLIDPASGMPADGGLAGVTVVAEEAWRAEVWAKAAFVAGVTDARAVLEGAGIDGFIFGDDGTTIETKDLAASR